MERGAAFSPSRGFKERIGEQGDATDILDKGFREIFLKLQKENFGPPVDVR